MIYENFMITTNQRQLNATDGENVLIILCF